MKLFSFSDKSGIVCGEENGVDLFIRKVEFENGYFEKDFHNHPNSFEFYIIINGVLRFATAEDEVEGSAGSIVYFEEGEPHKIIQVKNTVTMLLLKKVGSTKSDKIVEK